MAILCFPFSKKKQFNGFTSFPENTGNQKDNQISFTEFSCLILNIRVPYSNTKMKMRDMNNSLPLYMYGLNITTNITYYSSSLHMLTYILVRWNPTINRENPLHKNHAAHIYLNSDKKIFSQKWFECWRITEITDELILKTAIIH